VDETGANGGGAAHDKEDQGGRKTTNTLGYRTRSLSSQNFVLPEGQLCCLVNVHSEL
jgi:hypothetical protein